MNDPRLPPDEVSPPQGDANAAAMVRQALPEDVQHGGGCRGDDPPPAVPDGAVVPLGGEAWKGLLLRDRKGFLRGGSVENCILFLEHQYPGYFARNEFSDEVYLVRCPVWGDAATFKARRVSNDDIIRLTALLERQGLAPSPQRARDAIITVAHKSSFHPAREYFDGLVWDRKPRLHKWLAYHLGSAQHPDYLSTIGTMWMVAAVRRCYRPGTKFDHMLVLEGKTNKGKSTALRTLATFGQDEDSEEDYFCDSIALNEINDKATTAALQGKLIIEFQELDGMNKKDDTSLKRWITLQVDEVQKKYENAITSYPRQFVLAGTTNEDTWLRDPTGNRRYWPVKVEHIELGSLRADREQLWAEAVKLHKEGYRIWLSDDNPVYALAQAEQSARITVDAWDDAIMRIVDHLTSTTLEAILKELIPETARHDAQGLRRVASVLRLNGWQPAQERIGGKLKRVWKKEKQQGELGV